MQVLPWRLPAWRAVGFPVYRAKPSSCADVHRGRPPAALGATASHDRPPRARTFTGDVPAALGAPTGRRVRGVRDIHEANATNGPHPNRGLHKDPRPRTWKFALMGSPIHISIRADHPYSLSVWCSPGPTLPTADILRRVFYDWLARHCDDPFRSSLQRWTEQHRPAIRIVPVGTVAPPPLASLREAGGGEVEEGRLARATHEIFVGSTDHGEPRLALWYVLGMARSTALQYAAVVMDRDVPRLLGLDTYSRRLHTGIRIDDYVQVLAVPQREGRAHLTVRGMRKFQLPAIECQYVPRDLAPRMALLLQALAQILAYRARRKITGSPTTDVLAVPSELRVDLDHDALQRVGWKIDTLPNARRQTTIRLGYVAPPTPQSEPVLRLEAPPGWKADPRGWMATALAELLGGDVPAAHSSDDEDASADPLEAAHRRALKELPDLKRRFQRGLPGGHDAYVKRAFPLPSGDREYMWIHITDWYDDRIKGRLATHPRWRTDLHAGQKLQCTEDDVFDWLVMLPDGRELGGFTDEVPQTRRVPRPIPF